MGGGGPEVLNFVCFFGNHFFVLKTSRNFLMLWFEKDSLDRVGFGTYGRGSRVLHQKVTFRVLNVPIGRGVIDLGLSSKLYHIFLPPPVVT